MTVRFHKICCSSDVLPPIDLRDSRECCVKANVTHARCIDIFCDPHSIGKATVPDLMICAPWTKQVYFEFSSG